MDVDVAGLVPPAYAGAHVLVLPRPRGTAPTGLGALARSWFPGAVWSTAPGGGPPARPAVGARFRGAVPGDAVRSGELRLADGARAVGPFPVEEGRAQGLGVRAGAAEGFALLLDVPVPRGAPAPVPDDRDGLARAFPAGLPQGVELLVLGWAVAVARRVGGAVVADGRAVLAPDPLSAVDLTLYSGRTLAPEEAAGVLRTVVPGARVVSVDGPDGFAAAGETPYDGAVRLGVRRASEVPVSLGGVDAREHGPYAHHLSWHPQDPYELEVERPSGLHVIARSRVRVLVARLAAMLHGRLGGTVVDDGGFVVDERDLDERLTPAAAPTTSFWV